MRISEVSRRSGISATALRYYESIGLVLPRRSSNGYRDYDAATLHRLDLIEASKELGLPLADISRHLASLEVDSCTDVREQLRPHLAERVRQIEVRAFEKVQAAVKTTVARAEQATLEAAY